MQIPLSVILGNPSYSISGNADGNGYGDFEYAPLSNHYAINSKNLAGTDNESYTTIDDPTAHFQAKQYTGNGSSGHAITFDGTLICNQIWLWKKEISASDSHADF